jgi:RimJ/RimL family protein N-acetyltransferase
MPLARSQASHHDSTAVPAGPATPRMISLRLVLRAYRVADVEAVWHAIEESRASLSRWVPDIGRRRTAAEVRAGLAQLAGECGTGRRLVVGLWERASGRFLGEAGLYQMEPGRLSAEVGYWLRRTARGQGFATEAVQILMEHAGRELGLRYLEAHIAPENTASRRLAERQGFHLVGHRPADPRWDGDVDRVLIYARTLDAAGTA